MSIHPNVVLGDGHQLVSTTQTTFRLRPPSKPNAPGPQPSPNDELYLAAWSATREKINAVVSDLQRDLLDDLVTFVRTASRERPSRISNPIPTALLIGSSRILNDAVGARLKTDNTNDDIPTTIPIMLSSRACLSYSSTIKTIVTSLESNLFSTNSLVQRKTGRIQSSLARDDVDCIRSIYKSTCQKSSSSEPKIVLIIEDFEAFNPFVLQDLIMVLSGLMETMSIAMIFSLTTSADALHSLLPRTLLVRLQITPFAVHLGDHGINLLLQTIVFDPHSTFDISPSVIRHLIISHEQLNNSIDNVISKLQIIHLAYFHSNPLVKLFNAISSSSSTMTEEASKKLIDQDLEFIVTQLSLTTSWQSQFKNNLNFDNPPPKSTILKTLRESYQKRSTRIIRSSKAFELLKALGAHWPEKERTTEWLLFQLYQPPLLTYSHELCKLLRHSNDDSISKLLPTLISHFNNQDKEEQTYSLYIQLETLSRVLENDERGEGRAHLVNTHEPHLLIGKLVKADQEFSRLLAEISDSLCQLFDDGFGSKSKLILNEAWTFDDHRFLKDAFHPSYSETLKQDLETSSTLATDMGRLYELYKDSGGRRINLADWMGAFNSSSSNNTIKGKGKSKSNKDIRKKEASFICGVGGLGVMGFVGSEKRKAEHVARMVW